MDETKPHLHHPAVLVFNPHSPSGSTLRVVTQDATHTPPLSPFHCFHPRRTPTTLRSHQLTAVNVPTRVFRKTNMDFYPLAARTARSSYSSYCHQRSLTAPQATTTTKDDVRAWRKSRPLSTELHTQLSMSMWTRTPTSPTFSDTELDTEARSFPRLGDREDTSGPVRPQLSCKEIHPRTSSERCIIAASEVSSVSDLPSGRRSPKSSSRKSHLRDSGYSTDSAATGRACDSDAVPAVQDYAQSGPNFVDGGVYNAGAEVLEVLADQDSQAKGEEFWKPVVDYLRDSCDSSPSEDGDLVEPVAVGVEDYFGSYWQ